MNRTLFPLTILVALLLSACGLNIVPGSGKVIDEARTVNGYTKIVFAAPGELTISQDDSEALSISAEDNLLPYLRTNVENGVLRISVEPLMTLLQPTKPIRYTLSVKTLEGLTLDGSGDIRAEKLENDRFALNLNGSGNITLGELTTKNSISANLNGSGTLKVETLFAADLTLTLSGSGDVNFTHLQTATLTTVINGSGTFTAAGKLDNQTAQLNGSGSYRASGLESGSADISILGSGDGQVWVTETLKVRITGSGDVSYKGKASVTQTVTGSGNIYSTQ
jgi:hypothetical protein